METSNARPATLIECDICQVKFSNQNWYEDHIQSRSHTWAVAYKNYSQIVKESRPEPTFFECTLCNLKLNNIATFGSHIAGKKHRLMYKQCLERERQENCGIYVTGFPPYANRDELVDFFSKFGAVFCNHMERRDNHHFLIVQFSDANVAHSLIDKTLSFKNYRLHCQGRKVKPRPPPPNKKLTSVQKVISVEENTAEILRCADGMKRLGSFDEQMRYLFNEVGAPLNQRIPQYNQLFTQLTHGLSETFPGCRARPFGSTVTGLAFKDSDVDVYVQVLDSQMSPYLLEPFPVNCVKKARKALARNPHFSDVISIPWARTPIVKCVHTVTQIKCDFNFKSSLGVCNSLLIHHLLSADANLRPLVMILKYWAKVHALTGQGRFTNYALVMMALFYLQQDPSIVPPICVIQTEDRQNIQEGWNVGFSTDRALLIAAHKQTKSIPRLLQGFFAFYASFQYAQNVICPFLGSAVRRDVFQRPERLPAVFDRYKLNTEPTATEPWRPLKTTNCSVCVQDPFEQSYNLCSSVPDKIYQQFLVFCKLGAEICSETCTDGAASNECLPRLILEKPKLENVIVRSSKEIEFKISCPLEKSLAPDATEEGHEFRIKWFKKVSEFVTNILINVFNFQIRIIPGTATAADTKSRKLEGQNDIHDNNGGGGVVDGVVFHCAGKHNLWDARKAMAKKMPNKVHAPTVDREIAVSAFMRDHLDQIYKSPENIVEFELSLNAKINPTEVHACMKDLGSVKSNFRTFGTYAGQKLPFWFDKFTNHSLPNAD